MNSDLRIDEMMKSIDLLGRLAYGGQCVAAMAMLAGPALFVTASILPFFLWDNSRIEAIAVWLGGWALAAAVGAGGFALAFFFWRYSGDWISEWPGYAVGFGIAGIANLLLAYMLTSTGIPYYLSFIITMAGAFAAGFLVAGNLAGTHVLDETERSSHRRALARRR